MNRSTFILVVFLFFFAGMVNALDGDWELRRDEAGVKIYSSRVPGSDIKAVRGVVDINGTIVDVEKILKDPRLREEWDSFCKESFLHSSPSQDVQFVYVHHDMPWPVTDRDMLLKTVWHRSDMEITINGTGTEGILDNKEGMVRVTDVTHNWKLVQIEKNVVKVTTTIHLDPAGPIPSWLLNTLSVQAPFETLKKIKVMVEG